MTSNFVPCSGGASPALDSVSGVRLLFADIQRSICPSDDIRNDDSPTVINNCIEIGWFFRPVNGSPNATNVVVVLLLLVAIRFSIP